MTKKQAIHLILIPVIVLSFLDLVSTYMGVCYCGGIELNPSAILLIQRYGFIPAGLFHMARFAVVGLFLSWILWKSKDDEIGRTFVLVVIVLFLTEMANTVVLNFNGIIYSQTGKSLVPPDSVMKDVTPVQMEQIESTFEPASFCRLFHFRAGKFLQSILFIF
ncbi:MAG: hypothetical protein A2Y66_02465 [Nitrospirae bacterium RBG_13_41_22]|nr:MAG: hypothetical protein A2Y66_02465 [Nitrospirae bacterium RBG_13_41_22]